MKAIRTLLPHLLAIISVIFIVFLILDSYNPTMNFIDNTISLKLLGIFCALSILHSVIIISSNRKAWRMNNQKSDATQEQTAVESRTVKSL